MLRPRAGGVLTRWSTVFPLGMYAATSFAVGELAGTGWIGAFARTWTWVAVVAWIAVALAAARRG